MNQYEINLIKSKLRRLQMSEVEITLYVEKMQEELLTYKTASKVIDRWEVVQPSELVAQVLVCGVLAAVLGALFAVLS